MSDFTQDGRLLSISTSLGKDKLLLAGLTGTEGLSTPFHFELALLAPQPASINSAKMIGQHVTVTIADAEGGDARYINGVVSAFAQTGSDPTFVSYRAQVVPVLALLKRRADIRIFQQKSVIDVIETIFKEAGVDYQANVTGTYAALDYCVQYRETDLAFVSRLMEENGIFYFFTHGESKHTLVLADGSSAHQPCPGQSNARFHSTSSGSADDDVVSSWELQYEFQTGKYSLTDYNFQTPSAGLLASEPTTVKMGDNDKYETYDFPGVYGAKADGNTLTRIRMQEQEARTSVGSGAGSCRAFTSGYRFTLGEHPQSENNGTYVLTLISHSASNGTFEAGGGGRPAHYWNTFTCIPFATPFRPARVTPRPVAHGMQSAVVVGSSNEEIWVDKYGRVKVQFFWDRVGKNNEQSSCWVRVAQPWAGKNWGFVAWPRIGQEVLVAFEAGNPDRPVIVGSLYNAEQMPPYDLPANQTQTGIKTHSSKDGAADTFNELRFEDKKGSEEVHFQAEKNLTSVVKNDETRNVQHDRTTTIKNNETRTVSEGADATTVSKGDQTVDVTKGNQTITLGQGDQVVAIKMGQQQTTLDQGDQTVELKMGNQTIKLGMGNQSTKLDLGAVSTEALQGIELKVGQSSIKIDQMGVTIKGMTISVQGEIQTQIKGLIMQISADAMLQAKGAITMIN
ncbi:MAG: type VI secretion system Vgr family protein [Gemmatimonadaceae bacterium]